MAASLLERILTRQPDAKAARVLHAGYDTFLAHGLKRTSMQDIATRAGMSRAALYLHFKNKDDIYGAMMEAYFAAALEAVEEALTTHSNPLDALTLAFEAQVGDAAEGMMRSPHAAELLAHTGTAPRTIIDVGTRRLVEAYARWLAEGVQAGRIAPDVVAGNAPRTALVMVSALDGLKSMAGDWPAYVDARRRLARMFGLALKP